MMDRPRLVMIAGSNGAGKSTITAQFRQDASFPINYINPDEIILTNAEIIAIADPVERVYAAAREGDRQRQVLLQARESMAFETVMSHPSKIDFAIAAREAGYEVLLIFVGVASAEISLQRVIERVANGGHDVPRQKVIDRYQRVMALLPQAIQAVSRALLFDNSDDRSGARLVAEFINGQVVSRADDLPQWAIQSILF